MMPTHVLTVFKEWDGSWAVQINSRTVVYCARTRNAAEAYATDNARRWPPAEVRVLREDGSIERVWHQGIRAQRAEA